MARIDRLAAEDKRVLQAAAVIGRSLPFLLLQAILDPADEALRERLARLQGAEFLYETRAASELEYTFKHALTHEVAYASLLPAQRRALHARIVDALESWQREGREELVERLAHHAIQAEAWEKAVDYARRAGFQAMTRSAHRDAAAWFDQAVAALGHLPERRELVEQAIDIQFDLRNALVAAGRVPAGVRLPQARGAPRDDAGRSAAAGDDVRPPDAHVLDAGGSGPGHRVRAPGARHRGGHRRQHGAGRGEPVPGHGVRHARQLPEGDEVRPEEHRPAPGGRAARALRPSRPARRAGHSSPGAPALGPRRARRVRRGAARARREPAHRRRRSAIRTPRRSWPWGRGSSASARAICRGR